RPRPEHYLPTTSHTERYRDLVWRFCADAIGVSLRGPIFASYARVEKYSKNCASGVSPRQDGRVSGSSPRGGRRFGAGGRYGTAEPRFVVARKHGGVTICEQLTDAAA